MNKNFPELTTSRLLLRRFRPEDIDMVFYGLSHPEVIKYYGVHYSTLEETQVQMDWFVELGTNKTGIWWAICSADSGAFLGAGGFNNWSHEFQKAEIGFWLLPEHWGKGVMTEAMPLICNYGFKEMGLHRIEGFVETENQLCKKALRKLDFTLEGTMVDCEIKNGRFISLDIYAKFGGMPS
ncbi:MAG: GNAT family N-acetyltransferase [Phaeodactylibacter sp.]|nr:GNAT family N-acetyltransferase [Phaeodactylibacter sp.]MCB9049657.1 GNAT family N-acetyltransferase [Lewinellaceae bacterium]